MPIYEYECLKCGEKFEEFCRTNENKESKNKIICPKCGADDIARVYSTFGTPSSCGISEKNHSFG